MASRVPKYAVHAIYIEQSSHGGSGCLRPGALNAIKRNTEVSPELPNGYHPKGGGGGVSHLKLDKDRQGRKTGD